MHGQGMQVRQERKERGEGMKKHAVVAILLLLIVLVGGASCASAGSQQPAARATSTPIATTQTPGCTPVPTPTTTPTLVPTPTPFPTAPPTHPPASPTAIPNPAAPPAPIAQGDVILVSLSRQWLFAYDNGALVFANAVETGQPALPTPTGSFSVLSKQRNIWFTSPWPEGSPYYYYPTHINYAMLFKTGGFYMHDAWWHVKFGPGSNVPHKLPDGTWETGSHGCVGMTITNAARLYNWVHVGTPVIIKR